MNYQAWIAKAAKQSMLLETVDLEEHFVEVPSVAGQRERVLVLANAAAAGLLIAH